MQLQAVNVLKPIPEGEGCVAVVMAKLLPNVARTESPTGRTGECGIVIRGPKRKPSGTARGKTTFRPNAKSYIQHDVQSGEKHIADVRTEHGLVIEFQHSHLDPLERAARERFYGNMVWVVDGTRLQRDYPRFNKGKDGFRRTNIQGYYLLTFPEECFPAMWLDSSVLVIFDFRGVDDSQPPDLFRNGLWCLLPGRVAGSAVVVGSRRGEFVKVALSRPQLLPVQQIITAFAQHIRELRAPDAFEARRFFGMPGRARLPRRYPRF